MTSETKAKLVLFGTLVYAVGGVVLCLILFVTLGWTLPLVLWLIGCLTIIMTAWRV